MFTKGQAVHLISSWDDKGTFYVRPCIVHSCGKKRLILTDAASGEEVGRNFDPSEAQMNWSWINADGSRMFFRFVLANVTDEQAAARAVEVAREFQTYQIARMEKQIENAKERGHDPDGSYERSMRKSVDAIKATTAAAKTWTECQAEVAAKLRPAVV